MPDRVYWTQLAKDYVTAHTRLFGGKPTRHSVLLAATVAEFETNSGRAWDGSFNFGATQLRTLTPEEQAAFKSGTLKAGDKIPGNPGGELHVDTHPGPNGPEPYAVWFRTYPTQVDGVMGFLRILYVNRPTAKVVGDDPKGTLAQLAGAMFMSCYFEGSVHGSRPCGKRSLPFTAPEQANVDNYAKALERVFKQTIEPNLGPPLAELLSEEEAHVESPKPDTKSPVTAFGQRVADIAIAHCPCSAHVNQSIYIDVIVRPSDRTPPSKLDYFIGSTPPSTCGLFGCGCVRLAGWNDVKVDPEINAPYKIGSPGAVADTQTVGKRHGVLESGTPTTPFRTGDIVVITEILYDKDGKPYDNAHEIVCVDDAAVNADGSWTVDTVQGGQVDSNDPKGGSSAVKRITSTFRLEKSKRYAGSRYVVATVRCSRYVEPVVVEPVVESTAADTIPAPPDTVTDKEDTNGNRPIATGGTTDPEVVGSATPSKPTTYGLMGVIVVAVTGLVGYVVYLLNGCG